MPLLLTEITMWSLKSRYLGNQLQYFLDRHIFVSLYGRTCFVILLFYLFYSIFFLIFSIQLFKFAIFCLCFRLLSLFCILSFFRFMSLFCFLSLFSFTFFVLLINRQGTSGELATQNRHRKLLNEITKHRKEKLTSKICFKIAKQRKLYLGCTCS